MPPITARYETTEAETLRSTREVTRAVFPAFGRLPWFGGVLVIGGIAYPLLSAGSVTDSLFMVILGAAFIALPWLTRLQVRRQFRQSPGRNRIIVWTIDEKRLANATDQANGSFAWSALIEVRETADGFLLFPQPRLAHWLPKHAFATPDDIAAFRTLVLNSGVKRSGGAFGPGSEPPPAAWYRRTAYIGLVLAMAGMAYPPLIERDWVGGVLYGTLPLLFAGFFILLGSISRESRNARTRTKIVFWTALVFLVLALIYA